MSFVREPGDPSELLCAIRRARYVPRPGLGAL